MKPINQIITSGIVGTSAMTMFSYIASKYEEENFKEPEMLAERIGASVNTGPAAARRLGWAAHYMVGIGFAAGYKLLLNYFKIRPSLKSEVIFGALCGISGVFAWHILFKKQPASPPTDIRKFYIQ